MSLFVLFVCLFVFFGDCVCVPGQTELVALQFGNWFLFTFVGDWLTVFEVDEGRQRIDVELRCHGRRRRLDELDAVAAGVVVDVLQSTERHLAGFTATFFICNGFNFPIFRTTRNQSNCESWNTEIDDDVGVGVQHRLQRLGVDFFDDVLVFFFGDGDPAENGFLLGQLAVEVDGRAPPEVNQRRELGDFVVGGNAGVRDLDEIHVERVALVVDVLQLLEDHAGVFVTFLVCKHPLINNPQLRHPSSTD